MSMNFCARVHTCLCFRLGTVSCVRKTKSISGRAFHPVIVLHIQTKVKLSWWHYRACWMIAKVSRFQLVGSLNATMQFYGSTSNCC